MIERARDREKRNSREEGRGQDETGQDGNDLIFNMILYMMI